MTIRARACALGRDGLRFRCVAEFEPAALPTLDEIAEKHPAISILSEAEIGRILALPPFDACAAFLGISPLLSGRELATLTGQASAGQCRKWRQQIKQGRPGPDALGDLLGRETSNDIDLVAGVKELLQAAVRTGDERRIAVLSKALPLVQEHAPAELEAGPDWSRLTSQQFSALNALMAVANGGALDPEAQWWVALFARVPEAPTETHAAHIELPPNAPEPPILTTG